MKDSPGTVGLVPFRGLANAKSRLAGVMSAQQREAFVAAMLCDTLSALRAAETLSEVLLLTNDAEAAVLARQLGLACIAEAAGSQGLNGVVQTASQQLAPYFDALLVVHGDLPLLSAEEVDSLVAGHFSASQSPSLSIVADRHGTGSNILLCSPVDAMRFHYGEGSLAKHLAYAKTQGMASHVVQLASAGLDIDVAEDFQILQSHAELPRAKHLKQFLG